MKGKQMETILVNNPAKIQAAVREVVAEHDGNRSELVSILKSTSDQIGFLPAEAFVEIGRLLDIPVGEVYSVASFYTMLLMEPRGRHLVLFCESAPCHVAGGRQLEQPLIDYLGIQPGETSADDRWTLIKTSCLGQCARGPVVVIDDDIYGPVTVDLFSEIFEKYD